MITEPAWSKFSNLTKLWQEDDACRAAGDDTREQTHTQWPKLFHEPFPGTKNAVEHVDFGDAFIYLFPHGRVLLISFDGDSIYQMNEGVEIPDTTVPLRRALATPERPRGLEEGYCPACDSELPDGPQTAPMDEDDYGERWWVCPKCDYREPGAPRLDDDDDGYRYGKLVLSSDQKKAIDDLVDAINRGERVLVLKGPAGTGKTTLSIALSNVLADLGWSVRYMATTGKAANRLCQVVGARVTTIHKALFKTVKITEKGIPIFDDPQDMSGGGRVALFCDEGSMIGKRLYDRMIPHIGANGILIIIGDDQQLPPVADKWGPDWSHATAELTQIHRQAKGNPILDVATAVRLGEPLPKESIGTAYVRYQGNLQLAARWLIREMRLGNDAVVLCYSNKTRARLNTLVRHLSGRRREGPLVRGEQLLVLRNNRFVDRMNGETMIAERIQDVPPRNGQADQGVVLIRSGDSAMFTKPDLIGADREEFDIEAAKASSYTDSRLWVHLDYGYALTVHKAQGSEYSKVMFVIDNTMRFMFRTGKMKTADAKRLCYTAVTRAKEQVIVLDV